MQAPHTLPDGLLLENQLCFPLYCCAKEVIRRYREPLDALGLTYTQYIMMMILWEYGGMTEGALGRIIHLESGTLTPLLKRLERLGYITRVRPENNERILFIDLTEEGLALRQQAEAIPCAIQEQIPLSAQEKGQLKQLLTKAMLRMQEAQ